MMKKILFFSMCLFLMIWIQISEADDLKNSDIVIEKPWIRAMPPTVKIHAVYMRIVNHSQKDITLEWVTSDMARLVEIHRMDSVNGVMKMEQVNQVSIAAGETQTFESGGFHLMVFDVKKPLKIGDTINLVLGFQDGRVLSVDAEVRDGGMKGSGYMKGSGGDLR